MKKFLKIAKVNSEKEFYDKYPTEESFFSEFPDIGKQYGFGGNIKRKQYGLGSWLGDNASDILKTGAGAALTASGVGVPIGAGLLASGASGLAANNLVEDPNAQAALRATGQVAGIAGGAMMGKVGYAMGGNTQLSEFNNGGTHEENPNGGIPIGQNASVEQGETKWEDYIFSDRIKIPGAKHTFADESKKIQKKYPKERENDVPTQKAKKKEMERLMATQEAIRAEMGLNDESQVAAYGGRIKYPDGGSLVSDKVLSVDSSGILPKTIYDVDKLSPKAKAAYLKNPELFSSSVGIGVAPGAPKMETIIDTNKDAIMKSLNNSKTVSKTPSSISPSALKWLDEPGITGWQQSKLGNKNVYRRVTMGADGKPTYGPIEYAMGGRVKMNEGGLLNLSAMNAINQTISPDLGNLSPDGTSIYVNPYATTMGYSKSSPQDGTFQTLEEIEAESAQAVANQKALNLEAQNKYNTPATGIPTITTGFSSLGKPTASVETPGVVTPTDTSVSTVANPETNYVTGDTSIGNTTQKGANGFDKYDAITMGAQLLPAMYNIGQGLRKQKPVDLGRMTPNLVNYDSSRKASEDSFNQQSKILNESIRENATSSGQALSNRVAFANRAALDKANQLGQINEREYNTNQQIRGNADQVNLQIRANEEMIDAQNKGISQTSIGMGLAQIGQAAGTINRDRNLRNTEREIIGMMGQGSDFGIEYDEDGNPVIRFKNRKNTTPTTGKK